MSLHTSAHSVYRKQFLTKLFELFSPPKGQIDQGIFSKEVVQRVFSKYSNQNGQLGLPGFSDILSYLSDIQMMSEREVEVEEEEVNEKINIKLTENNKSSSDNNNNIGINDSVEVQSNSIEKKGGESEDDMENDDEISVEKVFKELSGKRKIVTFESVAGWDIVAELLEDGTLNIAVK